MANTPLNLKLPVETLVIGATANEGGSRSRSIKIGGEKAMPCALGSEKNPNPPVIAYEIWDIKPEGWNVFLEEELGRFMEDPVKWGNQLIEFAGAEMLFLKLMSAHPDYGGASESEIADNIERILGEIKVPLIITGCGIQEIDKKIMPRAAEAAKGERLLLGNATAENYREITAACIEYGHNLITESPIDINIAKQANILVQEAGLPPDRIVMYATTGALGYGLEYAYSIMEKTRLVGLEGDRYMNKPQIALVGQETWRVKESRTSKEAGILWETMTAAAYIHSGADIIVLRNPESGKKLSKWAAHH